MVFSIFESTDVLFFTTHEFVLAIYFPRSCMLIVFYYSKTYRNIKVRSRDRIIDLP